MRSRIVTAIIILGMLLLVAAQADESAAVTTNAFKTKTKSVAVFKDGYGFFIREGKARLYDGWAMTDFIPKAAAGSFWFYSLEPGTRVSTVRSTGRNEVHFENTGQLMDSLRHKVGVQVKIATADAAAEGELIRVLDDMVLIKSGKDVRVVQLADIKSAQVLGNPLLLRVDGKKKFDEVTVNMGYLQQGISWVPTYTLELISPTEAQITLRATITNGVEDLVGSKVYLVVGVPNFYLKNQMDPLTAHSIGLSVLGNMPAPMLEGGISRSQVVSNALQADIGAYGVTNVPASLNIPMEGLQEMYFYEADVPEVLVGDVVMSTVLDGSVPYRHLFTWNADGKEVIHHLVLTNKLASPFTTGPIMILQNGKPLSQDQLLYTPMGAETRVKITQATDMRTDVTEEEIGRKEPERIGDRVYIQVTSEVTLKINNHRKETADVEVTRSVSGKVLEASGDGRITSRPHPDDALNPVSSVKWTTKVEPGKDRIITYRYLRYVRAQ